MKRAFLFPGQGAQIVGMGKEIYDKYEEARNIYDKVSEISGIDVMDLEDAVEVLWKNKIYAESGMGCTGPIVLVSSANLEKSKELLIEAKYISE